MRGGVVKGLAGFLRPAVGEVAAGDASSSPAARRAAARASGSPVPPGGGRVQFQPPSGHCQRTSDSASNSARRSRASPSRAHTATAFPSWEAWQRTSPPAVTMLARCPARSASPARCPPPAPPGVRWPGCPSTPRKPAANAPRPICGTDGRRTLARPRPDSSARTIAPSRISSPCPVSSPSRSRLASSRTASSADESSQPTTAPVLSSIVLTQRSWCFISPDPEPPAGHAARFRHGRHTRPRLPTAAFHVPG